MTDKEESKFEPLTEEEMKKVTYDLMNNVYVNLLNIGKLHTDCFYSVMLTTIAGMIFSDFETKESVEKALEKFTIRLRIGIEKGIENFKLT
jgi:hypothetical protein